jgi:hypothetical protein
MPHESGSVASLSRYHRQWLRHTRSRQHPALRAYTAELTWCARPRVNSASLSSKEHGMRWIAGFLTCRAWLQQSSTSTAGTGLCSLLSSSSAFPFPTVLVDILFFAMIQFHFARLFASTSSLPPFAFSTFPFLLTFSIIFLLAPSPDSSLLLFLFLPCLIPPFPFHSLSIPFLPLFLRASFPMSV